MTEEVDNASPCHGKLTHGPAQNSLVERTLEFVRCELSRWRDRPRRLPEDAEERLNAQLCKHLNAQARQTFPMAMFHHEEKQAETRRVDISAGLPEGGFVGMTFHTIDDPFLVFEGKRLPTPGGKTREREYVTGGNMKTGGIQRFKLGLHAARFVTSAMIGYIQKDAPAQWLGRVNHWILEIAESQQVGGEKWESDEQLKNFHEDNVNRTASSISLHIRIGEAASAQICIHHLWVQMNAT